MIEQLNTVKDFISGLLGGSGGAPGTDPVSTSEDVENDEQYWCAPAYDCFIDSLNRILRPSMCIGVFMTFIVAFFFPNEFIVFAKALKELPDFFWYLILIIVSSWCASRMIKTARVPPKAPPVNTLTTTTATTTTQTVVPPTVPATPIVVAPVIPETPVVPTPEVTPVVAPKAVRKKNANTGS